MIFIGNFVAGKQEGFGECIAVDGSSIPCRSKADTQAKDFSGKDTQNISIVARKWVRISQFESNTKKGKKLYEIATTKNSRFMAARCNTTLCKHHSGVGSQVGLL